MKRWMIIAAIPVALLLAGALAVKLYFTGDRLRSLVVPRIESATNRKAGLGDISLSLFPSIGIEVTEFRLSNPGGTQWANPYFLSLKRLFIDVRLMPLFGGRLEIDRVVIDDPIVWFDVTPEGKKNYSSGAAAGAAAAGAGGGGRASVAGFLLSNLEITGGRIESHNRRLDTRWAVQGLTQSLRVAPAEGGGALTISGTSGVERFSYGTGSSWTIDGIPLTATEDILYRLADDRLEFTGLDVTLKDVPLKMTGSVSDLRQETMMVDMAVASPALTVEKLLSLLPAGTMKGAGDVAATGNVSFTMNVRGPSNDDVGPGVNAAFRLSDGTIRFRSLTKSITGVAVDGILDIPAGPVDAKGVGGLDVGRFAATLGASSVSGRLRVSGFGDPSVAATLRANVALDELGQYYPLEPGTALGGAVSGDVTLDGRPADPRSIRASGTMTFRNVSWSSPAMTRPVTGINGVVAFNNQAVDLKNLALGIGSSDIRLDATLKNYLSLAFGGGDGKPAAKPFLSFALKSKLLNTADISAAPDTGARPAGGAAGKQPPAGGLILPGIDMAGTVDVETLRTEKFTFTNAKGSLSMTDGVARVKEMRLDAFGGTVRTDGTLDLSSPETRPFDLKLDVNGVESNEMLSPFTTFGRYLFGTLDLTTSLKGDLNDTLGISTATLTGAGNAVVENGRLTGVPLLEKLSAFLSADHLKEVDFKNWSQSFSIADGKLNVKDLKIGGNDADITVNGVHGLDGSMDYAMHVRLPQSASASVKLPGVADQLLQFFKDKEGRLNLDFQVTGQTQSPVLKLDTRAQEEMLKQKARDEVGKKLSDPLKKAAEGLKNLFKPKPKP
jgi:hypothetical protein